MNETLENFTSANHSSVGSSTGKCALGNSGNSENVTQISKKNVQEFGHRVSTPCVPFFSPVSNMLKPQVSATRFMGVLRIASLKTSLMKIFCLELLSVFLRT